MAESALALHQSNGVLDLPDSSDQEAWEISQYEKIMEIRDQVFAGTHPRLKLLNPLGQKIHDSPHVSSQPSHPSQETGNIPHPASASQKPSATFAGGTQLLAPAFSAQSRLPDPTPIVGASGIDPIFLTKSDVLLRAETQQKRQRIERLLADQVKEKQATSKHKAFDFDDLPDFNVTEVLRRAQELVKPVKFAEINGTNGNASASDSFDENTFYSSQMNDSTPELVEKPALRQSGQQGKVQVQPLDNSHADTQASSGTQVAGQPPTSSNFTSDAILSQAERIARLEAELMALKGGQADDSPRPPIIDTRTVQKAQEEESVYSPPDAVPPRSNEESTGRKMSMWPQQRVSENKQGLKRPVRNKKASRGKVRERAERAERAELEEETRSDVADEGRVVRNHITSPLAPQPARVSPLAVARAPPIQQTQSSTEQNQIANPKKRRRELEAGQNARNVVARREPASPEIRVKVEPTSPPPFFPEAADRWEPHHRGESTYVDEVSPRYQQEERVTYRSNIIDRPAPRYVLDDYREPAPPMHEPDLRRVVSTRQARESLAGNDHYASPQPLPARAVSQMYLPRPPEIPRQSGIPRQSEIPRQYRASIQPEPVQYIDRDVASSPRFHEVPRMMGPPPRRIVVDQHGNQFYEQEVVPIPRPRQSSAVPLARQPPPDQTFQMSGPRHSVARIPQAAERVNETRYIRRGPSPASPQYIDYASPSHIRQPANREADMYYGNEPQPRRGEGVRMVEYAPPPPPLPANGRYGELRAMEGISRVSSVRPVGAPFEGGQERITRVQSVVPDGRRVVSMGGGETMAPVTRHMSIRPDDAYARPMEYAAARMPYYPGSDGRI
ncbi:MAG: hypothetical protein Q9182_000835 [Xanthomendoza sp. 2 TL-2023]